MESMNKRKVLRTFAGVLVMAAVLISACGKLNSKGKASDKKQSSTGASLERRIEVITGTIPGEEDASDMLPDSSGEAAALDMTGKDGISGSDIATAGNISKGKDTGDGNLQDDTDGSAAPEEILPINPDDMIEFTTDYGKVQLIHDEGAIHNLTSEVGEERYHDGGLGFYYNAKAGIKALVPGYYNYYQTD